MMHVRMHIRVCACVPEWGGGQKTTSGLVLTVQLVSETESHLCCFLIPDAPLQPPLLVLYKDKKIFYSDLFSNILFIPSL